MGSQAMTASFNSLIPHGLLLLLLFTGTSSAFSQELPGHLPTKEQLANDNKLFMRLASKALKWDVPTEPLKIVGPLYFVGTAMVRTQNHLHRLGLFVHLLACVRPSSLRTNDRGQSQSQAPEALNAEP